MKSNVGRRLAEIRSGFERPFWVANISEIFERLSYYAVFYDTGALLARNARPSQAPRRPV